VRPFNTQYILVCSQLSIIFVSKLHIEHFSSFVSLFRAHTRLYFYNFK